MRDYKHKKDKLVPRLFPGKINQSIHNVPKNNEKNFKDTKYHYHNNDKRNPDEPLPLKTVLVLNHIKPPGPRKVWFQKEMW